MEADSEGDCSLGGGGKRLPEGREMNLRGLNRAWTKEGSGSSMARGDGAGESQLGQKGAWDAQGPGGRRE